MDVGLGFAAGSLNFFSAEKMVMVVQVPEVAIRTIGDVFLPGLTIGGATSGFDHGFAEVCDADSRRGGTGDKIGDGEVVGSEQEDDCDLLRVLLLVTCFRDGRGELDVTVVISGKYLNE